MKQSSVRAHCAAALRDVEIPDPFDLRTFCHSLAARRGRRLQLHAYRARSGAQMPCGVYLSLHDADHIFFDAHTSPLHRDHIVLHEISHMLLGHGTEALLHETVGRLMPSIDRRTIETMLARTSYSTEHEREAELLATLIAGEAGSHVGAEIDAGAAPIVDRLRATLGHVTVGTGRR